MNELKNILKGLLWALVICALISMCAACSTTRTATDTTTHATAQVDSSRVFSAYVDSLEHYRAQLDSFTRLRTYADTLVIRDSVVVIQDTAGQVVSREKYRDTYKAHASTDDTRATTSESELIKQLQAHVDSLESLGVRTDTLTRTQIVKEKVTTPASLWSRICTTATPWLLLVIVILGTWIYEKRGKN